MESLLQLIRTSIHTVPDYPKEGILYRDITGLLEDSQAFAATIHLLTEQYQNMGFTKVAGTEARGFLFGAPLAIALGVGFVPIRKPNKLPRKVFSQSYQLEYGEDRLEIHQDAFDAQDKVLVIDDLLATGGTIEASIKLIRQLRAAVDHVGFVIDLPEIGGRSRLKKLGLEVFSVCEFSGH